MLIKLIGFMFYVNQFMIHFPFLKTKKKKGKKKGGGVEGGGKDWQSCKSASNWFEHPVSLVRLAVL